MDRIVYSVLFLPLLFSDVQPIMTTTTSTVKPTTDIYYFAKGMCMISGLTIGAKLNRSEDCKDLTLTSVNFVNPSQELFDGIADGLNLLIIHPSRAQTIYLPRNLTSFLLTGAHEGDTQVIVDKKLPNKLQKLTLGDLLRLPVNIGSLRSLKEFYCYRIRAARIDFAMFTKMLQLERINIMDIGGVILNNSMQLPSLRNLEVWNSPIKISNEISCQLPKLERLELRNNSLQVIPEYFSSISSLKEFSISDNPLRRVTLDAFANLKQLQRLSLSNTQLSELTTKQVVNLPCLENLYLDNNKLTELDASLWVMPALRYVSLSGNQLKQVEALLSLLERKVATLLMYDNPWDCQLMNKRLKQSPGIRAYFSSKTSCLSASRYT